LGGREPDALQRPSAIRDRLEPFQRQRQVGAALGGHEGVDLVDDDGVDRPKRLARARGEQQVQRFRRRDEQICRLSTEPGAVGLGGVARPDRQGRRDTGFAALSGDVRNFMQRAATVQWGLMIGVFCISHVPALLILDIPGYQDRNAFLLVFLVLVVQSSDVLQYVWGKLLGRRRIAPELSPSKTVEGFVGGVASATALGTALWWITPFSMGTAALISLVIALMGFLGGLVMSAIKRDRGVKDWGEIIEGHGGMLDRFDSICFSAPIFFHIVRYWWTP